MRSVMAKKATRPERPKDLAYWEGWDAYKRGCSDDRCPYEATGEQVKKGEKSQRQEWFDGFLAARLEKYFRGGK